MTSPSASNSGGEQCAEQDSPEGGAMERLRHVQWRLLPSESGRGWYTTPPVPSKSAPGPADPPVHKIPGKRRIVIARHGPYHDEYHAISKGYQGNAIRTTKYTLINFIPMNLFEQFHRAANLYFLFLVVLNWVPVVEAFQKEITMIPLLVVLTVIAFKDALEDYRRYRFDKKINNLVVKVYSGKQQRYVDQRWRDVRVGDFVRLSCNEIIPADMVLLYTSEPEGVCHIETSNLDGETNLKQRQVVRGLAEQGFEGTPEKFTSKIECEGPNNDLNRFRGFMEHSNKGRVGLHSENLLLRSCTIRNTETVVGIVVYAGHETKAMKNNGGLRYKRSKLERRLNADVLWSVGLLFAMCLTAAVGHSLWLIGLKDQDPPFMIPDDTSPVLAGFYMFWTMIIVLQVLIPISLYVSIEIVKLGQVFFIQNDVELYSETLDSTVQCRALNITEDLGQIQHLFSDKTGTLTENKMVFRRCSVAGVEYPHEDNARRLELYGEQDWADGLLTMGSRKSRSSMRSLSCHSTVSQDSITPCNPETGHQGEHQDTPSPRHTAFSSRMEKEVLPDPLLLQKLNSLSSPDLPLLDGGDSASLEITYIVDFFLALAVCNTVVVSVPHQPRHALQVPDISRSPLKSLEDVKLFFQRFAVPRFASFSPQVLPTSPGSDSPGRFAQRLFSRTPNGPLTTTAAPGAAEEESELGMGGAKLPRDGAEWTDGGAKPPVGGAEWTGGGAKLPGGGAERADEGPAYEAESPDEAALVHAARAYGCVLRARAAGQLVAELPGVGRLPVPLLHVLPFDSTRKRMSVVVRHPLTGRVVVYTKGADSGIMDLLTPPQGDPQDIREETQRHLDAYAREGLRTLCVAKKVMEEEEYETWLKRHVFAETSIENREELLMESAQRLETGLTLLGATGIVDRLQEDVPETIDALRRAGIRVWILTGDKQETAVNIACACRLLRPSDRLLTANCSSKEACEVLLASLRAEIEAGGAGTEPGQGEDAGFTLVMDGRTLDWALQDELQDPFLELTRQCRAVICCRSTPLQKSQVVRLVRDRLGVTTLAIGDGANDVSMIQVADVGVGISGQEGMQAVMSSDFAVSRFKHLRKLLLVHGHWCYTRLANMVLYFFYKNVTYVNLLFWYQFYCGFSGATMTNYWVLIFFNLLFTSAPPLVYGVLDKDVSADTLLQLPELYRAGQNSQAYLPSTFWLTMLDAFYQSLICFFIPYLAYADSDIGVFSFGTPINTSALFIILLHQVIESHTLTWLHGVVLVGSALFYFTFTLVFSVTCVTCNSPANPLGIDVRHMSDPLFYCVCALTTLLALLPRMLYRSVRNTLFPSDIVKASRLERLSPAERCARIQSWREGPASPAPLLTTTVPDPTLTASPFTECQADTDSVLS
ncbi:probable phospholipid-transporting ATPase VD isoform X2 [Anguilla anguilla]|uniref:probable phospholipid-transporting ATPase VD isoform X2 n=1 Tax=Anguilla anguilla TaxID=7936 RepID=UPI0015ACB58D|nr:probable phospholipid-transporting ATPase VD isoform X2 [Anguilla anguilla]